MSNSSSTIGRHSLTVFLVLTILLSVGVALAPLPPATVPMLMVLIPALVAVCLSAVSGGKAGLTALLRKLLEWKIGWKWYLVMGGLALAIRLAMSCSRPPPRLDSQYRPAERNAGELHHARSGAAAGSIP